MAPGDSFRHSVTGKIEDKEWAGRFDCCDSCFDLTNGSVNIGNGHKSLVVRGQFNAILRAAVQKRVSDNFGTLVGSRNSAEALNTGPCGCDIPAGSDCHEEHLELRVGLCPARGDEPKDARGSE